MLNIKRITALLALTITASIILAGCASGPYGTETFDVSDFDRIRIDTFGEFIIEQGDGELLSIEAPRDYLRYIIAEVDGDTLVISTRRGFFGGPVRRAVFTIGVEDLEAVSLAGAGTVKIYALETDSLDINLSGAGSIEIDDLNANRLDVNLSSAGAIIVAGAVEKQDVNISGVGSYEAGDLRTEDTEVRMSGAGSAVVWAEEDLEVEVSGVGTVTYFGNPSIYQNITGLGSVNSRGERD